MPDRSSLTHCHHSLFPWISSLLALILSQRKTFPPNIACLFEINSYREKIMKWCEHWYTCWLHSHEDWQDLKRQSKFLQKNRLTISLILELLMLSWNINIMFAYHCLRCMHALDLNLTVLSQQQTGKLFSPPFQFSSIHIFILKKKYIYIYIK